MRVYIRKQSKPDPSIGDFKTTTKGIYIRRQMWSDIHRAYCVRGSRPVFEWKRVCESPPDHFGKIKYEYCGLTPQSKDVLTYVGK